MARASASLSFEVIILGLFAKRQTAVEELGRIILMDMKTVDPDPGPWSETRAGFYDSEQQSDGAGQRDPMGSLMPTYLYEEGPYPEGFFVPYVWSVTVRGRGTRGSSSVHMYQLWMRDVKFGALLCLCGSRVVRFQSLRWTPCHERDVTRTWRRVDARGDRLLDGTECASALYHLIVFNQYDLSANSWLRNVVDASSISCVL